jgi:hypothetical protein
MSKMSMSILSLTFKLLYILACGSLTVFLLTTIGVRTVADFVLNWAIPLCFVLIRDSYSLAKELSARN